MTHADCLCHAEVIAWERGYAQASAGAPCDEAVSAFFGFARAHRAGYAAKETK